MGLLKNLINQSIGIAGNGVGGLKNIINQVTGDTGESDEEIREKLTNSKTATVFAILLEKQFYIPGADEDDEGINGGNYYKYLIANTNNSTIWIRVYNDGIAIVKQRSLRIATGFFSSETKYEEENDGFTFGACGVKDLPNLKYCDILQNILYEHLYNRLNMHYDVAKDSYIGPVENPALGSCFVANCIKIKMKEEVKQNW